MLLKSLFFFYYSFALLFSISYGYASPASNDKCSHLFGQDKSSSAQKPGVKEEKESQKNPKPLTSKAQQKRGEKEARPVRVE